MTFNNNKSIDNATTATILRVGLGLIFVIGGYSKLSQLLDPERTLGIVSNYTGGKGYINEFFLDFLFTGNSLITPWGFLTTLSTFELISGLALVMGLLVRPLALIYAFLLWTFVFSLPVVTTPGVESTISTYTSPAMFVQIRDIALSGMMFVLLALGSGRMAADRWIITRGLNSDAANWETLGLLLRLSLAAPLIIGGVFGNYAQIATFATYQPLLLIVGLMLALGLFTRQAGAAIVLIMIWFMATKINADKSLIANLNGFKREFAFLAAGIVIALRGSGTYYTPSDIANRIRYSLGGPKIGADAT
jgi:uncharacterized membrane protein YphA (DoxX/SURF4 family)